MGFTFYEKLSFIQLKFQSKSWVGWNIFIRTGTSLWNYIKSLNWWKNNFFLFVLFFIFLIIPNNHTTVIRMKNKFSPKGWLNRQLMELKKIFINYLKRINCQICKKTKNSKTETPNKSSKEMDKGHKHLILQIRKKAKKYKGGKGGEYGYLLSIVFAK